MRFRRDNSVSGRLFLGPRWLADITRRHWPTVQQVADLPRLVCKRQRFASCSVSSRPRSLASVSMISCASAVNFGLVVVVELVLGVFNATVRPSKIMKFSRSGNYAAFLTT